MFKRLFSLTMFIILLLSISIGAFAAESIEVGVDSKLSKIEQILADQAFNEIKDQIISDYDGLYKFDNFDYNSNITKIDDNKYITIDIYADMTLIRHPSDSPFVEGMEDALKQSDSKEEEKYLRNVIDDYVNEINTYYYNIPNRSTFTYAIDVTDVYHANELKNDFSNKLYYRNDTSDEILLVKSENLSEPENAQVAYQNGFEAIQSNKIEYQNEQSKIEEGKIEILSTVSYDRIKARDWARNNAFEKPEYPSSSVPGTDCANFVSKAINAGGIPEDRTGKWYRASTWGGWPGDHWFRTGYNGSTGVVIYMTNKGYFYKELNTSKVFAGSIMYWNNTSHVALVTYGDGTTIKYTEHGAKQTKDTVYRTENASFYMPKSTILKN